MLLPTVLAEDTPHFLRAVGVLPVMFLFPALALDIVWRAARRSAGRWRAALPALIVAGLAGSLAWTVHDYFGLYAHSADTAYLFQSAATELAQSAGVYLHSGSGRQVLLDQRFWDGFASVRFLLPDQPGLAIFPEGQVLAPPAAPLNLVPWPYLDPRPALKALAGRRAHQPDMAAAVPGRPGAGDLPAVCHLYRGARLPASRVPQAGPWLSLAVRFNCFRRARARAERAYVGSWSGGRPGPTARRIRCWRRPGQTGRSSAQADGPLGTTLFPSELAGGRDGAGSARVRLAG